jgi:putative flippase GtrA
MNLSGTRRFVRFGANGIATFFVQIGILLLLKSTGMNGVIANAIGLAVAVQFNFLLSEFFVWSDRRLLTVLGRQMVQRWATFHGVIALSLVLNFGAFPGRKPVYAGPACGGRRHWCFHAVEVPLPRPPGVPKSLGAGRAGQLQSYFLRASLLCSQLPHNITTPTMTP